MTDIDAVVLLSFGGPEGPDDVVPFLERVTAGRDIPAERLSEVGAHYGHFDGVSPINAQCRRLRDAVQADLDAEGLGLRVYWGNRNWHPFLADTVQEMADNGVRRALGVATSAYSSYSGCRQYLEDIERARSAVGDAAPEIEKIRPYFDHPGFVEPFIDATRDAQHRLGPTQAPVPLVFTAHSIPATMAAGCDYQRQLAAVAEIVAEAVSPRAPRALVWQSRSGPPSVPWLEPDINDHLRTLAAAGHTEAVISPIGFVSDHMEVVWDLDHEAQTTADGLGLRLERAATPGTRPDDRFVAMIRQLIEERTLDAPLGSLSALPARPWPCAEGCCPAPKRPSPSA